MDLLAELTRLHHNMTPATQGSAIVPQLIEQYQQETLQWHQQMLTRDAAITQRNNLKVAELKIQALIEEVI